MTFNSIEEANDFIAKIKAAVPGLEEKIAEINKEEENRKMLQEEQNLQEALNTWKATRDAQYARAKELAYELDTANSIAFQADEKIGNLEKRLEDIHKKWIAANPAKEIKHEIGLTSDDIHNAFNIIRKMYHTRNVFTPEEINCYYKRFDNLLRNRCKTTSMFNCEWNIVSVINFIYAARESTLADKISKCFKI